MRFGAGRELSRVGSAVCGASTPVRSLTGTAATAGGVTSGEVEVATTAVPRIAAARLCAGGGRWLMIFAHRMVRR